MSKYMHGAREIVENLAYLIKKKNLDDTGLDLHFTINPLQVNNSRCTKSLMKGFDKVSASDTSSDLPKKLNRLLMDYWHELGNPSRRQKGLQIYVLTDGIFEPSGYEEAETALIRLTQNLDSVGALNNVGIQFIRFGNDANGIRDLDRLDRLYGTNTKCKRYVIVTSEVDCFESSIHLQGHCGHGATHR